MSYPIFLLSFLLSIIYFLYFIKLGIIKYKIMYFNFFRKNKFLLILSLSFLLFSAMSIFWSPAPGRATGALIQTTAASLIAATMSVVVLRYLTPPRWINWGLAVSMLACCLLLLFEISHGSPIRGFLGASVQFFRLNRAVIFVVLLLPLLFVFWSRSSWLLAKLALFALVWMTAFTSDSEAAKLALVVVTVVLVISIALPSRLVLIICGSIVLLMHLAAPAIVWALYTFLPPEFYDYLGYPEQYVRSEIWWAHIHLITQAPLFGQGLQASIAASNFYDGGDQRILEGLSYGHPHNFSIQVWFELGLVGIVLSAGLAGVLLLGIFNLPERQQIAASALMSGVWSVAYVSHGAWQHWWWAMVGIVVVLFAALTNDAIDRDDLEQKKA